MRSRKTSDDERQIDTADALFSVPNFDSVEDLGAAVFIILALAVVAIIVIPLLLFGIELILLGLLLAAGIVGRTLLGRPWVVQAVPAGSRPSTLTWRVVGWRRSACLIEEVATSLEAGLDPAPAEAAELLAAW